MTSHESDVIIVGAGVAGLSTAWQLAKQGRRVRVFDQGPLLHGSTGRASGLIGQLRATPYATRMLMDGIGVIRELEDLTSTGLYHQTGSIRIAQTTERVAELEADRKIAKEAELEIRDLSPDELSTMMPGMRTDDVLAAAYIPTDGYVNPPELARAYYDACMQLGVDFQFESPVDHVLTEAGKATGVHAASQLWRAHAVVNAAGPWAQLVSETGGELLATEGVAHFYFTTRPESGIKADPKSPTLRDRENRIYTRPHGRNLRIGIYESVSRGVHMRDLPEGFSMEKMTAPKSHPAVQALIAAARDRFPFISEATPMDITGGVMAFTPDGQALMGESMRVRGFFSCAGFCGHGVTQSPMMGIVMANLVCGLPDYTALEALQPSRFDDWLNLSDRDAVAKACREAYRNYYGPARTSGDAPTL